MPIPILPRSPQSILAAVRALQAGDLVGLPTETVYGLAADAANGKAVARIFSVKGRPSFNPLICHVTGLAMADRIVDLPAEAKALAEAYWPGPLTLVLPQKEDPSLAVHDLVSAGLPTLAVRAPAHAVTRQVLHEMGCPVAAPSANPSTALSPTRARDVAEAFTEDDVALVLEGGAAAIGIESTIIGFVAGEVIILRPGSINSDDIAEVIGRAPRVRSNDDAITAPGQLARHYAPTCPVRLEATIPEENEFMIGFGAYEGHLNLSPRGDLVQAASRLFAALREGEASNKAAIAVAPIPARGIGIAINDRLTRAATITPQENDA
ncbi:MAG: L-threonylcarbamoyladenylate synthase [Pseudomonadota bacterium]